MKLPPSQFNPLALSGLARNVASILFYGEEEAFVLDKVNIFIQYCWGLKLSELTILEGDKVLAKEVFLSEALLEQTFWEDVKKAIWVRSISERGLPLLKEFLDCQSGCCLIVTADKYLKPASKLRQYYEEGSNILSMGCFPPTEEEIKMKITELLKREKKSVSPTLLQKLSNLLVRNPLVWEGEMKKLLTYLGEEESIQESMIEMVLSIDEVLKNDDLLDAFFDRKAARLVFCLQKEIENGGNPIGILRMILAQARRLYALHCLKEQESSWDNTFSKIAPPVFSHQRDKMRRYLNQWSPSDLEHLLEKIMVTEIQCKNFSETAVSLCEGAILAMIAATSPLKIA